MDEEELETWTDEEMKRAVLECPHESHGQKLCAGCAAARCRRVVREAVADTEKDVWESAAQFVQNGIDAQVGEGGFPWDYSVKEIIRQMRVKAQSRSPHTHRATVGGRLPCTDPNCNHND